jgi:hypothetical protein
VPVLNFKNQLNNNLNKSILRSQNIISGFNDISMIKTKLSKCETVNDSMDVLVHDYIPILSKHKKLIGNSIDYSNSTYPLSIFNYIPEPYNFNNSLNLIIGGAKPKQTQPNEVKIIEKEKIDHEELIERYKEDIFDMYDYRIEEQYKEYLNKINEEEPLW